MALLHLCDYGAGNIFNVERALRHVGAEVVRCVEGGELVGASALVIPGVGAFGDCIAAFRERGFEEPVRRLVRSGAPVLGVCVGMQILATSSVEFGRHLGLDVVPGTVQEIPGVSLEGASLKRPHIGWAPLERARAPWEGSILADVGNGARVYFVHSFELRCDNAADVLAVADYGGNKLTAAVQRANVTGVQFHPEKSGEVGLGILRRFVAGIG
jgi:glutamine amidotransferase